MKMTHALNVFCILALSSVSAADTPVVNITALGANGHDYTQGSYSLGFRFTAKKDLNITALGFYDDLKDGIVGNHDVGIYDVATQQLLVSTTVVPSDPLTGFFRYHTLGTPYVLPGGKDYYLMAVTLTDHYYYNTDLNSTEVKVDPAITFVALAVDYSTNAATALHYPSLEDNTAYGDLGPGMLISNPGGPGTGGSPPVITAFASSENPALLSDPISFSFSAADAVATTLTYTLDFGDGSPPATGSFAPATSTAVTHAYTAPSDTLNVTLTVSNGSSTATTSLTQVVPTPASSGLGVTNIADNTTVIDPLDGLAISVIASNGGIILLGIDISSLPVADYDITTVFGDIPGQSTTVTGLRPVHQYIQHGIFVADVKVTDRATGVVVGHGRKTLAISTLETGESQFSTSQVAIRPRVTGDAPSSQISTRSMKGKFVFNGQSTDNVTFSGMLKLPPGLETSKPHEVWFAMGNIVSTTTVDGKGNGVLPGNLPVIKKVKLGYLKVKKGAITVGGEDAKVDLTFNAAGFVASGFDTEGISNKSLDVGKGKKAPRSIQVALLLDGVAYQAQAAVSFSVSNNTDFGTISGRTAK